MAATGILKAVAAIMVITALILVSITFLRCIIGNIRGKRGGRIEVKVYQRMDGTPHLVLVRHDDRDHLSMIGGPRDLGIETYIDAYDGDYQDSLNAPNLTLKDPQLNGWQADGGYQTTIPIPAVRPKRCDCTTLTNNFS